MTDGLCSLSQVIVILGDMFPVVMDANINVSRWRAVTNMCMSSLLGWRITHAWGIAAQGIAHTYMYEAGRGEFDEEHHPAFFFPTFGHINDSQQFARCQNAIDTTQCTESMRVRWW